MPESRGARRLRSLLQYQLILEVVRSLQFRLLGFDPVAGFLDDGVDPNEETIWKREAVRLVAGKFDGQISVKSLKFKCGSVD